jgi:hypothetical protein
MGTTKRERRSKPGCVLCAHCDDFVSKEEAVKYEGKNYHPQCVETRKERDELLAYICKILEFKAPGPVVFKQLNQYFSQYPHYTYKGIQQALYYFYEVLKKPVKEEVRQWGIAIVPKVYDQAQEYFTNIRLRQERVAEEISDALSAQPEVQTIVIKKEPKKKKELYDLENIF